MNQQLPYLRSGSGETFVLDVLLNLPRPEFEKVVWKKVEPVTVDDSTAPSDDK